MFLFFFWYPWLDCRKLYKMGKPSARSDGKKKSPYFDDWNVTIMVMIIQWLQAAPNNT